MTIKDVQDFILANEIQMIDFKMVDIDGKWRHLTIPSHLFGPDMMTYGVGFDASSYGFAEVEKSDMIFIPDLESMTIDPFTSVKTLAMLGDVFVIGAENKPFDQYPRNIARSAEAYMKNLKIADQMIVGPEFEFNVLNHVTFETNPNHNAFEFEVYESEKYSKKQVINDHGYQIGKQNAYHVDLPSDSTFDLRNEMCIHLENWGVPVKYHHHEVGSSGQLEIEVQMDEMRKMADRTMIAKYVIKNTAKTHGLTATFMPKPIYGEAGNGMHVHMLLLKDGNPVFYDPKGYAELSLTAHYFMGGILKHIGSLCAFTNPSTNSYKRLIPGFEAPVTVGFAMSNRSAIIRIPSYAKSPMSKRFELRNPDATSNPYFAYAAILMAGLDGIKQKIDPKDYHWGPFDFNLYTLSEQEQKAITSIPKSLDEALNCLEKDHHYLLDGDVFPISLIHAWIDKKRAELKELSQIPNPAEFKKYYNS